MYPRDYFDTYWRGSIKQQVFVAMSFDSEFEDVWKDAIQPAVERSQTLPRITAYRTNTSILSGSIITDILEGIAHSLLLIVDISVCTKGKWKGQRNGNVMYELGLAHALRPSTDIIVVRSDVEEINFDLAGINIHSYRQDDLQKTRKHFQSLVQSALQERKKRADLLIQMARERLDGQALKMMWEHRDFKPFGIQTNAPTMEQWAVARLLDANILRCTIPEHGRFQYEWTEFGKAALRNPNRTEQSTF